MIPGLWPLAAEMAAEQYAKEQREKRMSKNSTKWDAINDLDDRVTRLENREADKYQPAPIPDKEAELWSKLSDASIWRKKEEEEEDACDTISYVWRGSTYRWEDIPEEARIEVWESFDHYPDYTKEQAREPMGRVDATISFRECPLCASKPGSPVLCGPCIHNRRAVETQRGAINILKEQVEHLKRKLEEEP